MVPTFNDIEKAAQRLKPHILNTPLIHSKWLSDACGGNVYLKLESEQYTCSFKARGSLNKLMWLREKNHTTFTVTASSGNHGLGFAHALQILGMKGKIYLPLNVDSAKLKAIQQYRVEIELYGKNYDEMEAYALQQAEINNWVYVSPYNDKEVIAGQGTIVIEISEIMKPDNILATVGGGGLISGIGIYMNKCSPDTKLIGCQPQNSPEMSVSVQAGVYQNIASKPTLSDGSAGGFEPDSITFELCQKLVNDFILVSEEEIKQAVYGMIIHHSKLIEGAAGVAVASLLQNPERFEGQTTVIVICGSNISPKNLLEVLTAGSKQQQ